jgi:hypothetical protein
MCRLTLLPYLMQWRLQSGGQVIPYARCSSGPLDVTDVNPKQLLFVIRATAREAEMSSLTGEGLQLFA